MEVDVAGAQRNRRRVWIAITVVVALAAGVSALMVMGGGGDETPTRKGPGPTTTTLPTTTTEPDTGPVAPLTGLRVAPEDADNLDRPALAVKIDNHPKAFPQWGLLDADVVVELRVEGISRFLAVFHSQDVDEVGPVRSARTSDPDLLAMFGRPLTAWSGANPATKELMRSIPWIQDVSADRYAGLYRREGSRRAPHNLVLDATAAFEKADADQQPPAPLFSYRSEGTPPPGEPVAGVEVSVGQSRAQYVWDGERGGWARWSDGKALFDASPGDPDGGSAQEGTEGARLQVAPVNVLVLETRYERSSADPRSPEAVTVGDGRAWVFTAGHRVEGTWSRPDRTAPWSLVGVDGAPVVLSPGPTWVALVAPGDEPRVLDAEAARRLRGD